jgi:hypothetical protein
MDEILTFIIIWVVLYLINLVSKKIKKQQTSQAPTTPAPPVPQVPRPSILDSLEEEMPSPYRPQDPSEIFESDEEYFEEEEEPIEQEVISEAVKRPEETVTQAPPSEDAYDQSNWKASTPLQRSEMSLKQYIIWKEILDKPLSIRNRYLLPKNRVS